MVKPEDSQIGISSRSDLSDADIEGADFTNALLDKPMQTVRHGRSYNLLLTNPAWSAT